MKYPILIITFISSIIFACKSKSVTHPTAQQDTVRNEVFSNPTFVQPKDTPNIFKGYDAAKRLLNDWNNAINNNSLAELEKLYHDTLNYHGKPQSLTYRLHLQKKHQEINPDYKQSITRMEIYNMDEDTMPLRITAEFDLIIRNKNFKDTITSLLTFEKIKDAWKIVGETDLRSLEFEMMNKRISKLDNGKYIFSRGYWVDTRDDSEFGHEQVPYQFAVSLDIQDTITGDANLYSGRLRENTEYLIPEGKMQDGMLELVTIWNGDYESSVEDYWDGSLSQNRIERWTFKIIDGKNLFGVDCNAYMKGYLLTGKKE